MTAGTGFPAARRRHCIVTPEIVPLVLNGGVGTNALHLAAFLTEMAGLEVVVLMTRLPEVAVPGAAEYVRAHAGAALVHLEEVCPPATEAPGISETLARSLRVHRWLEQQDFSVIHFMQYQAAGFAPIRAKRLGRAYLRTRLVTILNSPERWLAHYGQRLPLGTASGFLLDYMERYGVQWADHVTSPSVGMLEWLRADGWTLAPDTRWLPTYSPVPEAFEVSEADPHHVVFFGRLETRKGLELFVEALLEVAAMPGLASLPIRITFLGKVARAGGRSADTYVRESLRDLPPRWSWELLTHLDQGGAMEYLRTHSGALYVMPSRADNSPNTVTECLNRGLRVLCCDVPGVREQFADRDHLVEPTVAAWAPRLARAFTHGERPAQPACSPGEAIRLRLGFLRELEQAAPEAPASGPGASPAPTPITVVVPHHNLGRYLRETLDALSRQTDPAFEVIVVDDGSTCPESLAILVAMERGNADRRFRFVRQAAGGVCAARNLGATLGSGPLLVFVDADNLPLPHMLETMRRRLEHAGLDALTCDLYSFDDGCGSAEGDLLHSWAFAGGCLEAAVFANCLGDSNMMIRREAFARIGGFHSAPDEASSDRALLVRLLRHGFRLDATDECLFAYRRRADSMSRTADDYQRGRTVMAALNDGLEPWLQRLMEATFPIYGAPDPPADAPLNRNIGHWRERYRIEKAKRRERDQRVDHLYGRISTWRRNSLVRLARFLRMIPRDY